MAPKPKKIKKSLTYNISQSQASGSTVGISSEELEKEIKGLKTKISDFDKTIETKLETVSRDFYKEIKDRELRTTEILAIFFTLFTFISVSINIFTRVEDLFSATWFLFLITSCSIIILSVMFLLISKKINWFAVILLFISLLFIWILLFITTINPNSNIQLQTKISESKE